MNTRQPLSLTFKTITHESHKLYNQTRSAGHAKWQNIKNTKQANDVSKGKLFSRYVLMVKKAIVMNKMQGDPKLNPKLADVLSEAYKLNVPKATLERAIVRATNLKIYPINLEVQGPAGCTLIVRCETENANNLRREVKKILKKYDSSLLPDETSINMFRSRGFIRAATSTVDGRNIDQDFAEEAAIVANAEEVYLEEYDSTDESLSKAWVFNTNATTLNPCKGELEKQGFKILSTDLELVPYREVNFGEGVLEKVENLSKALSEMDQVLDIFHNCAKQ